MKKLLAPAAIAAILLTGCGGEASDAEAPNVPAAAPAETTEAETNTPTADASVPAEVPEPEKMEAEGPQKSERGNVVKDIGEGGGIVGANGDQLVSLVINEIDVDGQCTGVYAEPSEHGHFVILDVSVETSPNLIEEYGMPFNFSYGWKAIAPNGTTSNADPASIATYSCLDDAELLPDQLGPAEKATGKIVLDVENPKGILVWSDFAMQSGLEWEYPTE